jgi:dihydroflavonol-4-reductase
MKAFVTGANGFTGSHLVKLLLQQGIAVTGLVRRTSDLSRLVGLPIELVYGELSDRALLQSAIADVDYVFHTAAYVELGLVDARAMERVNVQGTRTVLEAATAARNLTKFVYCSTIGIFGDTQGRQIDETFERQQQGFSSAYDRTKYQAQQLVDEFTVQGLPAVSVLPSGIFGADDPHFGPVIQTFLKRRLKFWAGGDRITGIVHVDDLVAAMLLAAEQGKPGEHFIISAGEMTTRDMFAFLSQETGIPAPKEVLPAVVRLAGNILDPIGQLLSWQPPLSRERVHYLYDRCVRVSADKAIRTLGWQPRSVEDTLRELVSRRQKE